MKQNRVVILLVAVVLLVVGALLSRCSDEAERPEGEAMAKAEAKERAAEVVFPRDRRATRRAPPPPAKPGEPAPQRREAFGDPIQRAMAFPDGGAVFVEVNAIRHSPLVERILACRKDEATDGMRQMKETLGIDPLEDVDRMALHDKVFAVSGFFDELKLPSEAGEPEAYGDGAQLYRMPNPDDPEGGTTVFGRVGEGLLLLGEDEAEVKAAIDRAEGRGETGAGLPLDVTQSEVYGRFGPELLTELLGNGSGGADPLVARVSEIVTDGTVRILVDDAVSMSLDLETNDAEAGEDLSKAIGGALAGARAKAESEGNADLAALLDRARVLKQEDGRFGIDVAVPGDVILDAMGCGEGAAPPTSP